MIGHKEENLENLENLEIRKLQNMETNKYGIMEIREYRYMSNWMDIPKIIEPNNMGFCQYIYIHKYKQIIKVNLL